LILPFEVLDQFVDEVEVKTREVRLTLRGIENTPTQKKYINLALPLSQFFPKGTVR
jgi:hypothetical protein